MNGKLSCSVFTDIGGREINEDSIGAFQNGANSCYIVCDGLGGHGMGDVASSLVVSVFKNKFEETDNAADFLGQAFCDAQSDLMEKQKTCGATQKMKTTCVVLTADEKNVYIGHVGDSRCYVFAGNKVKTRTSDHSVPQMLVLSKEIKEEQIRNHPDRNMLLRVMGVEWDDAMYELMQPIPLKKCQAFLLCSDGFWELIEEKEMCRQLKKSKSVSEWLDNMVEIVRENGAGRSMDNFSAIAVWNNS